jgi:flavorubredoxin
LVIADVKARVHEIERNIYRISVFAPAVGEHLGLTYNHFLVVDDEPLLFHCGLRKLFPQISTAVARIIPLSRLRWLTFGHLEADECGSMNEWLAAAPRAQLAHGAVGCRVSIADMADRRPRVLSNGEVIDLGTRRIHYIDTPHIPHGWDAGVLFEETTRTLFCGDLFAHFGNGPALTEGDIVSPAIEAADFTGSDSLTPTTASTIRALADLAPSKLALMHGSSFSGDTVNALRSLADYFHRRLSLAYAQTDT